MAKLNLSKVKNLFSGFTRIGAISTLKGKLILAFTAIVLIMGTVSIVSYLILSSFISRFDKMVDTTVFANDVTKSAKATTENISKYILEKDQKYKDEVWALVDKSKMDIEMLKSNIVDEKGLKTLDGVERLNNAFVEKVEQCIDQINNDGRLSDAIDTLSEAKKIMEFIEENVEQLITIELSYQEQKKAELNANTTLTGIIIIVVILAVCVFSIFFAGIFSSRIGDMIAKIAKSAKSISNGDLSIEKVSSKSKDDIALLAQSFNKMVENLRELIGNISETSRSVAQSADTLKLGAEQSTKAIEQIASSSQQVFQGATEQSEHSEKTVEVINYLIERNRKIHNNSNSVFAYKRLRISEIKPVGDKKHLKMVVKDGTFYVDAIGFNMGEYADIYSDRDFLDLAFSLEINTWNSVESVQLNLKDIKPNDEILPEAHFYYELDKRIELKDLNDYNSYSRVLNTIKAATGDSLLSLADKLIPERMELAAVYKYIRTHGNGYLCISNLFAFSRQISNSYKVRMNYFKVKKSIEIFEELNLLKKQQLGSFGMQVEILNSSKTNLEKSSLYIYLQKLKDYLERCAK
jgi:methyl-accepting chemotaxis protein